MKQVWHLSVDEAAGVLETNLSDGLSGAEVRGRQEKYGANQLKEKEARSPWGLFFDQFRDFIIWVLTGAALVSGFLGEWVDAFAIIAIVILNAILGFIQEYRAEKSLAALKKLSSPTTRIIRDRLRGVIPSSELVVGDLVELEAGDHVPADCRVVWQSSNFATMEASLTGESTPVAKTTGALAQKEIALADRTNMVYMGTAVVSGKSRVIVSGIGMGTELGRIAGMIQDIDRQSTPLQRKLEEFGRWIVYLCFVLVGLVFAMEMLRGGKIMDVFLTSVSLAVAAIPEGLPAVVTIALALGVRRMVKRNVLIRKLPSVETLGCTTIICSDKTGTLTKNEMTVQAVFAGGKVLRVTGTGYQPWGDFLLDEKPVKAEVSADLLGLLRCSVLCNGSQLLKDGENYRIVGDPTEASLLTAAAKADIYKEEAEKDFEFVDEIPFDSERKMMTIVRRDRKGSIIAFVKGAPDVLLDRCTHIATDSSRRVMTDSDRAHILKVNDDFASEAMRVLAVASRELKEPAGRYDAETVERELVFAGLAAMIDPPREEVKKAIAECAEAGIRPVMITGDHKNTAVAIAKQLGFFREDSAALTGEELDRLSDEEFSRQIEQVPVYARVSPEHKLRIVRMWRGRGQIVAMTGDGVNDAPAVKEADIGVAMGITGTDVTKEVSDMVVTDDNFSSIVAAVEEGRGIYDNIKKFVHYLLSCNTGEILVMFAASLIGMPVPLLPIQILWVNLITDGLPALALGVDPVDPHIMHRRPRRIDEAVVTRQRVLLMLGQGAFIAFCSLGAFSFVMYAEREGLERARTAAFTVLSCSQLFHAFNCRSETVSLFTPGVMSNAKLILATGFSFVLQMAVIYLPFMQIVFKTEPLGLIDRVMVVAISSLPLWAMEAIKIYFRKINLVVQ